MNSGTTTADLPISDRQKRLSTIFFILSLIAVTLILLSMVVPFVYGEYEHSFDRRIERTYKTHFSLITLIITVGFLGFWCTPAIRRSALLMPPALAGLCLVAYWDVSHMGALLRSPLGHPFFGYYASILGILLLLISCMGVFLTLPKPQRFLTSGVFIVIIMALIGGRQYLVNTTYRYGIYSSNLEWAYASAVRAKRKANLPESHRVQANHVINLVETLAMADQQKAVASLLKLTEDRSETVARAAKELLLRTQPDTIDNLIDALDVPEHWIRQNLTDRMLSYGGPITEKMVTAVLHYNDDVDADWVETIYLKGEKPFEYFMEIAPHTDLDSIGFTDYMSEEHLHMLYERINQQVLNPEKPWRTDPYKLKKLIPSTFTSNLDS